ncbi:MULTISPECIES: SsgA family sporulation/cell division regulator [unclassified Streptomyces]|uniref:SsgA family sporulation/cell division regulator n=1 Tax=unclassified Streptomyces TaxID=2593676 RepID=UPI002E7FCF36|nr:SsgA family sporulation/cell division regulator [Streptomyces sp. NBC_00589]WTI40459.1 SsgA family sporulation/cell division regulator [Streptomyces sp. NBC_00775]WUB25857.1 SsgA family sporulation/cell division regulator [Streptomyces sp. NBC_00589]
MKSMRTVMRGLPVQLVVSQEMSLPIRMRLRYELSDPYAVRVAFTVDESDEAVEWIIGRDLLIDGLKGPVGEGDVQIWPAGERDCGAVYIVLKPPSGVALLEVPTQDIKRFLRETETLVPSGSESEHIDSDALLRHLLGDV